MTQSEVTGALRRLREGNERFASGEANRFAAEEAEHRRRLAEGQAPEAVVLTCSDSRVPPTLVFDRGLGDLFVVRVAGNIVTPEQLGSVEFAVGSLGTRLVVVLGHTRCGAVTAAFDVLAHGSADLSPNLRALTDRIQPAVELAMIERVGPDAKAASLTPDQRTDVVEHAIRLNVEKATAELRSGSELLDRLAGSGDLTIVGAEYCLETGTVDFFA